MISGNKSFVKLLKDALPENESVPMKKGKKSNIPALAQDDDGCKRLLAHSSPGVRNLMLARKTVKSWPLHIKRVTNMERQANANNGELRIPLNYYAAHTGRWGGTEGINLHNLGGRGRAGIGIDPLIGQIRELLCAHKGYTLGISDSAQLSCTCSVTGSPAFSHSKIQWPSKSLAIDCMMFSVILPPQSFPQ